MSTPDREYHWMVSTARHKSQNFHDSGGYDEETSQARWEMKGTKCRRILSLFDTIGCAVYSAGVLN
jgi:hypothetical protein